MEIEAVEPTESQQKEHDESFSEEETLDAEDSIDVDWEFLDLALQGALIQNDAQLSTEARNNLPDSAFCGPERSFPVPDCAHVTAARRLIERSKYSDSVKKKIMSCVDKKAESFKCDKSDDFLALEKRFEELQASYNDLETKFKETLEALVFKQEKDNNIDEEKNIDNTLEENVELTDNKVENPSEHAIEDDNVVNKKQESILDSFEQSIVDNYKKIKESNGQYAADSWFSTQAHYLPRGFNPENF